MLSETPQLTSIALDTELHGLRVAELQGCLSSLLHKRMSHMTDSRYPMLPTQAGGGVRGSALGFRGSGTLGSRRVSVQI